MGITPGGKFVPSRCQATHWATGMCCLAAGHTGDHKALSPGSGLFVQWSTKTEDKYLKEEREPRRKITHRTDPIKSWRWWIVGRRGILSSITSGTEWLGPVVTTKQLPDGSLARVAPDNPVYRLSKRSDEDYGVYSYKTPELLLVNAGYQQFGRGVDNVFVLGQIDNYGHVVEHDLGYRSQKAVIQAVWIFYHDTKLMFNTPWRKSLENRYECEVEFVPNSKLDEWAHYYSLDELE